MLLGKGLVYGLLGSFLNKGGLTKVTDWIGDKIYNPVADTPVFGDAIAKATGSRLTTAEREANEFNAAEAQKQRDYEEQMSNTQFQRGVADAQRAVLIRLCSLVMLLLLPLPVHLLLPCLPPEGALLT